MSFEGQRFPRKNVDRSKAVQTVLEFKGPCVHPAEGVCRKERSLCETLCELCVSVVGFFRAVFTTETQRSH